MSSELAHEYDPYLELVVLQILTTVELQWLEHLWDYEIMFETGGVRANECQEA